MNHCTDIVTSPAARPSTLQVFSAGVARSMAEETIAAWNREYPEFPAELTVGGSVELVRRVLSGDPCDVLIAADNGILDSMMMPEHAKGYVIFAGNQMVIAANNGFDISSENWKDKLLSPDATFSHHSPYDDPGGYRSVMSMMLAEKVEPGLAEKLLQHPGHYGMNPAEREEDVPEIMYSFDYYSNALAKGVPFAELPEIMNLSSDELAASYASAKFTVDDAHTVSGTPICHALTIPEHTANRQEAQAFAKRFLAHDFSTRGFVERRSIVGDIFCD